MKKKDRVAWGVIGVALLLAAAVIWFLPVNVSRDIRVPGKVFAHQVWSMERSGQGTLHANLQDRAGGLSDRNLVQTISRGDVAEFALTTGLRLGTRVVAGDTIGTLTSSLSDREVTEMSGAIDVLTSEARTYSEGAKAALIEQTQQKLVRERERLAVQESIVARLRSLQAQGAVAVDEVERAEREEVALRGRTAIVEAEIAVLQSGARPSEQRLAAARLGASMEQLSALQRQRESFVVRTPISGVVTRPASDSVLIKIVDTDAWVAAIGVPVDSRNEVAVGDSITFEIEGRSVPAVVMDIGREVATIAGLPSIVVTCTVFDSNPELLVEGLLVEATISLHPVRLRERVRAELAGLFRWRDWWGNATRV